jgi:hypothetical protein
MGGDRSADDHTLRPPRSSPITYGGSVAAVPTAEGCRTASGRSMADDRLEQSTLVLNTLADLMPGWQPLSPEIKRWHDCLIGALHLA